MINDLCAVLVHGYGCVWLCVVVEVNVESSPVCRQG